MLSTSSKKILKTLLLMGLIGSTSFVYSYSQKNGHSNKLSATKLHLLQQSLDQYRTQCHIPGISVSIVLPLHSSRIITLTSGIKNTKSKKAVTPNTLFQICSITKVYTAILVHQLMSAGKLKLSQTVGEWLPQYKRWGPVTIKQLLDMHSGIPSFTENQQFNAAWEKNPKKHWTPSEKLNYIKDKPLLYKPGTKWNYSDTNYIVLGLILEKESGKPYSQLLEENIIKPLQLKQTFYIPREYTKTELGKMAAGYSQNGKNVMDVNMSQAGPAGAIVATTRDAAIFISSIFTGKLLTSKELKVMLVPYSIRSGKQMNASSKMLEAWAVGIDQFWMPKVGLTWNKSGGFVGFFAQACYSIKGHVTIVLAANKWVPKAFFNSTRKFIPKLYNIIGVDNKTRP